MKKLNVILPDPEATEKTGIDTADEFTFDGPTAARFIEKCEACGLDPEKVLNDALLKVINRN